MIRKKISRRKFLATGAAAAVAVPGILRAQNAPNRLNIAIIGCGGRGAHNLSAVSGENIVALCDVNSATAPFRQSPCIW